MTCCDDVGSGELREMSSKGESEVEMSVNNIHDTVDADNCLFEMKEDDNYHSPSSIQSNTATATATVMTLTMMN